MKKPICLLAFVFAAGLVSVFVAVEPSHAQDTDGARQSKAIDDFIRDYKSHQQRCANVTNNQSAAFTRCQNEQGALAERQQELGVKDDQLRQWKCYHQTCPTENSQTKDSQSQNSQQQQQQQ